MNPYEINFSFSFMKGLMRSPRTAIKLKEKPKPTKPDQYFNLAIEVAVQEPAKFEKEYHVLIPEDGKSDRKGTNAWKAAEKKYGEGKVLKQSEYETIMRIYDEWNKNEQLKYVYSSGDPQLRLEWRYKKVKCKGYADWYSTSFPSINDIKVVNDASDEAVANIIARQYYDIQAAIYRAGASINNIHVESSLITFIEKQYPYMVNAIEFTEQQLEFGHSMYLEYVEFWSKCLENNEFPGYGTGFHSIKLPGWHTRKYLESYYED